MGFPTLLGLQGAVYVSTNGRTIWGTLNTTTGIYTGACANSLSIVSIVRNVTLSDAMGKADFSSRYSNVALEGPALETIGVEFDIPWTPSDSGLQLFISAYYGRYPLQMAVLDNIITATPGAQGVWADWAVMEKPLDQPLDKEQSTKIKLSPTMGLSTLAGVPPAWVQV